MLLVALAGLFLLPTHDRIANAAADNPPEGVWRVMDVGGQPAAGVSRGSMNDSFVTHHPPPIDL